MIALVSGYGPEHVGKKMKRESSAEEGGGKKNVIKGAERAISQDYLATFRSNVSL